MQEKEEAGAVGDRERKLGGPLGLQAVEESSSEIQRAGSRGYSLRLGLREYYDSRPHWHYNSV